MLCTSSAKRRLEMVRRRGFPRVWLLIAAASCGGKSTTSDLSTDRKDSAASPAQPPALEKYREGHELWPYKRYAIPGVALWQVTVVGVSDLSWSSVVGIDERDQLVEGWPLFQRAGDVPPAELAGRALDILFAKAPGDPLEPATTTDFFPAEQRAIVTAPAIDDGVLVFWTVFGDMAPRLTRVRLDLSTGDIERTSAQDVLHPPPDPLPPIRAKLQSEDPATIVEGLIEVSEHCELAADVAALLRHSDPRVRSTALDILGNLGDARWVPDIIRLMREGPEWSDRSLAGQKLFYFAKHPDALEAVRQHVATAKGQEVSILRDALAAHARKPIELGLRPCERRRR